MRKLWFYGLKFMADHLMKIKFSIFKLNLKILKFFQNEFVKNGHM